LYLILLIPPRTAVEPAGKEQVYTAYITNRMEGWKAVIDRMESAGTKSDEELIELVNYEYGYIGYCLGFDKKEEGKKYFEKVMVNIEKLRKSGYKPSLVNAYLSAFYGFRISFNKLSAPVSGIRGMEHAEKAIELDPGNYLGYVQYGNGKFYMPAAFGGSKKEALEYLLKARSILEKNPSALKNDWNYLSLLVLIGQTYTYIDDYESAKKMYDTILLIEPRFIYVKDMLYPALMKKMAGN
jgi:tetratricopeptide (TPR) repeat protein